MAIRAILWDFGNTLADERFMHAPLDGAPDWSPVFRGIHRTGLVEKWNLGQITSNDVAVSLAAELEIEPSRIVAHMRECCRNIHFYPVVMDLVANCAAPQAIVTINPDIFTEVIVPTYDLSAKFPAIVTSWQEGTLSKADLCEVAMGRLDRSLRLPECVLIDNKLENVLEWRARGGAAYHFDGAASLADRFTAILEGRFAGTWHHSAPSKRLAP